MTVRPRDWGRDQVVNRNIARKLSFENLDVAALAMLAHEARR
jgi:hypothetical protein